MSFFFLFSLKKKKNPFENGVEPASLKNFFDALVNSPNIFSKHYVNFSYFENHSVIKIFDGTIIFKNFFYVSLLTEGLIRCLFAHHI